MAASSGRPPADVVSGAGLAPGERVLAAVQMVVGGWALATMTRLVVVDDGLPEAVPWSEVWTATLLAEDGVLDVRLVDHRERALLLGRGNGRRFAETVRERVQNSVLLSRRVELGNRREVRVAARRGADGIPFLQVVPDPGVDLLRPDVAEAVADAERAIRDQVGMA